MSNGTNLEGLAIPQLKDPDRASFDPRPKFIATWVTHLPMANLGETSRMVFKAVVELNRLQLPVQDRYKSLETLREPCQYIIEALEKHFTGRPLPLNEKNRKISELSRAINSELALGYKIVAKQLTSAEKRPDQSLLLFSLHRAINYLGQLLYRSYQVYAPSPRNVWHELHTIYYYAEQHKILDSPLKDTEIFPHENESTIASIYNKALMLSLTMPYRLQQGEVNKVCALLNKHINLVKLEKIYTLPKAQDLFIVNLCKDQPPGSLSLYQGSDFHNCRLINANMLTTYIQKNIDEESTELTAITTIDLLRRLLSSWSIMSKRSSSRTAKQATHVETALGISAAHHYVSGEKPFSADSLEKEGASQDGHQQSKFHSTKVHAISDVYTGPDIWTSNYTYSANDPRNAAPDTSSLIEGSSHIQSFEYKTVDLAVNNISASGYCLTSRGKTDLSAHVGDLLAIREYQDKNIEQWGIGVIRRMMSLPSENIELGIEMLTPNAIAVAARLDNNNKDSRNSEFMRCLMLPELRTIDQPATIITPALPFKEGSRIRIQLQDKQILAVLSRQWEKTRSFSQFEFSIVSEEAPSDTLTTTDNKQDNKETDFEILWTSL